jgi:hypothetical protein
VRVAQRKGLYGSLSACAGAGRVKIWLEEGAVEGTRTGSEDETNTLVQARMDPEAKEHYR